jgi:hypothetical protein
MLPTSNCLLLFVVRALGLHIEMGDDDPRFLFCYEIVGVCTCVSRSVINLISA